jgi:hypothetical protein
MPLWLPRLHHGLDQSAFDFSATPVALLPQARPSFASGESGAARKCSVEPRQLAAASAEPFTRYGS